MIDLADRLSAWVRGKPFFLRMTLFTRILLAAGFIPTGLVKLMGHRFTVMSVDTPIGAFFEAMYQTGMFWRFIGLTQVVAGILLLVPRFAHLGAAIFLPIMVNIFLITVSLGFRGTPVVTGMMLLAVVYLCAWDYYRFRSLFTERPLAPECEPAQLRLDPWERVGFWAFALSLMAFWFTTRGLAPGNWSLASMAVGLSAGLFTLARFVTTGRKLTAPSR